MICQKQGHLLVKNICLVTRFVRKSYQCTSMYIKLSNFQSFLLFILWLELKTAVSLFFLHQSRFKLSFLKMIFSKSNYSNAQWHVEMELKLKTYMYNICHTKVSHLLDFFFFCLLKTYVYLLVTGTLFPKPALFIFSFCIVWYSETISVPSSETLACMLQ